MHARMQNTLQQTRKHIRVIPYQINKKKILTLSDFFENWHTCWVHRETTPDQNLAYFDYPPLRYDRSIFEQLHFFAQTAITLYVVSVEPCNLIY